MPLDRKFSDLKQACRLEKGFGRPKRWGKLIDRSAAFDETPPKNTKNTVQARNKNAKNISLNPLWYVFPHVQAARCLSLNAGAGFVNGVLEKW